jgi:hypothetical protein
VVYEELLVSRSILEAENRQLKLRLVDTTTRVRDFAFQVEAERKRADVAIDQLLMSRGTPPVTPGPVIEMHSENPLAEDPEIAAQIEKRVMEFGPHAAFKTEVSV